ncbi:unnamed protein product [Clonostachys rhizophaga]|uniref:Armadillo repeat-containing protein 8 n=1 Tax=Clonostachys rhizophaga TaxID=160324 RepID=A0A9N9YMR7_9HYPO|nr:unnamed protein product [Clonostachys rhizophaga]
MARPQNHPILAQLKSARTTSDQTASLRALKNEIVGHIQRKEAWVALGVLEPIVRTISSRSSLTRPNGKESSQANPLAPAYLSEEDGTKLQALQLVASFAHGGPTFLAPLHACQALPAILSNISPYINPPQIVIAALRALTDIADASALADSDSPLDLSSVADQVFTPLHLESFNAILSISSSKHLWQTQASLAAGLISRLCKEERQQNALTMSGVLDSLAAKLASFAVSEGFVVPGAGITAQSDGLSGAFPEPAPSNSLLGPVLDAIATILGDSKYRAHRLVYAPAILAVFPSTQSLRQLFDLSSNVESAGRNYSKHLDLTAMECVLPAIPTSVPRSASTSQSSLANSERSDAQINTRSNQSRASSIWSSAATPFKPFSEPEPDEMESPLIPWLVHLVRTRTDYERLVAASVLTSLYKADLGSKAVREMSLGLLVIPILVEMMIKIEKETKGSPMNMTAPLTQRVILERAPLVLARLINDCEYLQMSAFSCLAAETVTKLLKRAYLPVRASTETQMWSPRHDNDMDVEEGSPVAQLGPRGQDPLIVHVVKVREATLKAVTAIALGKEEYRNALVREDVIPYVVQSLSEFPNKPHPPKGAKDQPAITASSTPGYGTNPLSVIIAGCHAVRGLTRSVSILRTTIVDHDIAPAIFEYMKHPNVDVRSAATATMSNLVLEFSPVREMLTEKGVMKILCEHAHSDNPSLRLNAIWALKHFVGAVGADLKKACLEQLEPGWLVQLIIDDTQDTALYNSRTRSISGEDMDEDQNNYPSSEPHRWIYGANGIFHELDGSQSTRLRQAENKLSEIRDSELNPVKKARNEDIAIQEQALQFVRNLTGHPGAGGGPTETDETTEMIDFIFSEIGQDRLFDLLVSKLSPKVLRPFASRGSVPGRDSRVIYPQPQIIAPVIFILVHIAASVTRHRQLIIAQTELLKLLQKQSNNKDREVRVALCHLVSNLTYPDEGAESEGCKQRAQELKNLGFYHKLEALCQEDRDLDVRERAKTAVWQIEQLSQLSY